MNKVMSCVSNIGIIDDIFGSVIESTLSRILIMHKKALTFASYVFRNDPPCFFEKTKGNVCRRLLIVSSAAMYL